MESVFEAFISNPALYSAGHLVGETLHFPTNTEEVQSLLKQIVIKAENVAVKGDNKVFLAAHPVHADPL